MSRFQRSLGLAKSSWSVLRSEKRLAWFPVISAIASLVVLGAFSALIWFTLGKETGVNGNEDYSANVATYLLGFCMYVALAFVQTYFLAALCAGANDALQGRDTTVGRALEVANSRLHRILPWAIVAATVSVIIRAIEERFGIIGRIIASLIGVAWAVVTFLTVPIIVFEDLGPIDALKRSGTLLKQTWGENIMAQLGLGLLGLIAVIPGILLIVVAAAINIMVITLAVLALAVAWMLAASVVIAALGAIYRTALYRYAVDGVVPVAFANADLEHAFGPRKRRLGMFGGGSSTGGAGGGFSGSGFAGPPPS